MSKEKQQLENYTNKYIDYDKWLIKETKHYVFHYFPKSLAEKEIDIISKRQERAFKKIIKTLKLELLKVKIKYYIYPSEDEKTNLMGSYGIAQAIWCDFSVHIVYTNKMRPLGEHEDTHLLTLGWGITISFIQEGVAEFMSGNRMWDGKTCLFWFKKGIKNNIVPTVASMMTQKAWMDLPDENACYYYAFAKIFIGFLIENFGLEKFIKLYKFILRKNSKAKNIKVFEIVYEIKLSEIEKKFYGV